MNKKVCFGCTICFNYLHDFYNCQGKENVVCHEFNDKYITKEDKIIQNILVLQNQGNIENTLDYIFNTIDDLLTNQQFMAVNDIISNIPIEEFDINSIDEILTITNYCSDKLISINEFYEKACKHFNKTL
jgi:hypothetical protein